MEQGAIDSLEDGSASPESNDENFADLPTSEEQTLSKNRSKRKPSKTQIKHIAQGSLPPIIGNDQPLGVHAELIPDVHGLCMAKKEAPSHASLDSRNENCVASTSSKYGTHDMDDLFNDVTQGIFRDSHVPKNIQVKEEIKIQKKVKKINRMADTPLGNSRSPTSRPSPCYPCGICGKVFRVPSRYDSHMLGHSKGKPFCCNTCGKMFSSQEKLERHLPVHNCDRHAAFTCESCGKVCVNWRAYLYHMKAKHTESGGKRFSCNLCGRQFHSGQRLRNHMASHDVGKNHCCHVCGKLFESSKKLAIHSLVHNLSSMHNQNLQCDDCGRQYTEWIAFKQHMKTHGAEGVHYPCGICGETFSTQYEKEKHKRVHKQVQCGVCHRYFRSSSVLSIHLRIHTGEKPYKCGLCDKDFSQLSLMKIHMRVHINQSRYDCKICTAIFTDVMDYFKHYITHFEDGNLHCDICDKVFDNIKKKNRHMAAHQDKTDRQCHVCGKEFGRVSHLEAHMLCHSDNIPLMCKVCGKMFSSQDVLTAHYSIHVKPDTEETLDVKTEGPVFCGLCGKMFKDEEYLSKHMKRHGNATQEIKSEDILLDEDVIETVSGQFSCIDCGKTFDLEDHVKVHRREHTGEKPHICVMCGESFMLRKLLFEHGLTHKQRDLGNSSVPLSKIGSIGKDIIASSSSSLRTHGDSDSGSGSETDTDCDHEENIRQNKGKHYKNVSSAGSSFSNSSYVSSVASRSGHSIPVYPSHQQEYNVSHTDVKFTSQNNITTASSFQLPANSNESLAPLNQVQGNYSYRDSLISHNNQLTTGLHHSLGMKDSSGNLDLRTLRSEPQLPIGMNLSTQQDFKTAVSHHIPMSYSRAYMTPHSMTDIPPYRTALNPNFHGPSARFHTDLHPNSLSNFQLLPQTAFHEQTHHM